MITVITVVAVITVITVVAVVAVITVVAARPPTRMLFSCSFFHALALAPSSPRRNNRTLVVCLRIQV